MAEDAITDEICDLNPFKGIRIRASDPRAKKKRRPIRVFSFEEMHRFAKAAGRYEALVRTFADTGMRLGEVLPLRPEDFDGETLGLERPFELDRKCVLGRELVASGQRVAECHNLDRPLGCAGHIHRPNKSQDAKRQGGQTTLDVLADLPI